MSRSTAAAAGDWRALAWLSLRVVTLMVVASCSVFGPGDKQGSVHIDNTTDID
jgi:hypothetical protein